MTADLYAILVLSPLLVAGILIVIWGGWMPKTELVVRCGIIVVVGYISWRLCPLLDTAWWSHEPILGAYIPSVSMILALLLVKKLPIAISACVLFFVMLFVTGAERTATLLQPGVSEDTPVTLANMERYNLRALARCIAENAKSPAQRSGFVDTFEDVGIQNQLAAIYEGVYVRYLEVVDWKISPCWHTWFTRLYHEEVRPTRIWFDGGRLDNLNAYHPIGVGRFTGKDLPRHPGLA